MEATLTELHRSTRRLARAVIERGEHVILTEHGRPVAMMVPFQPVKVVTDLADSREGILTDGAILDAVREAREEDDRSGVYP